MNRFIPLIFILILSFGSIGYGQEPPVGEPQDKIYLSSFQVVTLAKLYLQGLNSREQLRKSLEKSSLFPEILKDKWKKEARLSGVSLELLIRSMQRDLEIYWRGEGISSHWLSAIKNSFFIHLLGTW